MSKSRIFQFTWFYQETNDKNQIKWDPDMIKSHQGQFWKPQDMRNSIDNRVFGVLQWLLIKVSVRYQNRPCLGREWVIDHQYLRRFRSNNRVLQNNAIYGKRCIKLSNCREYLLKMFCEIFCISLEIRKYNW